MNARSGGPRPAHARVATAIVFVLLGFLQGTLAARMPGIKDHAQLSGGQLGLALLGMPVGSIAVIQATLSVGLLGPVAARAAMGR